MKKTKGVRKTPLGIERRFDDFGVWLDKSWALRKAAPILSRYPRSIIILTWLIRIAVGGVFIISGLSKAIDPWGSYYKTIEYLTAMHVPIVEWGNTVVALVFLLFSVEFLIGVSILTGSFRKAAPITAALFMLVMLPLTLWIAVADPVADCGCFGDFLILSNWATFIKNCILSLAVVWLIKFNVKVRSLISPYLQWIGAVASIAYVFTIGYIGYWQQPVLDFRPYKIGSALLSDDDGPEYNPVYNFVYEKDGQEIRVGENDILPDKEQGWKFVRREEEGFQKNPKVRLADTESRDFRIWSEDGDEDVTDLLTGFERQLILLVPDISSLSMATNWKINMLYDLSRQKDTDFFAVVAGSPDQIEEWRDLSSGQYPIYTAEDTSIKELARGNPALVSLENGIITWKTTLSALNLDDRNAAGIGFDDDMTEKTDETPAISTSPLPLSVSGVEALRNFSVILLTVISVLALASILGKSSITSLFTRRIDTEKDEKKDGEAP